MSTFYTANVTATNGSAFVEVNSSNDDIGILRRRSLLQIGTNQIVEVKQGLPGTPDQIELSEPWPFATTTDDAVAAPTAGDLAEAVEQIRTLTQQGETILADAMVKSDNLAGLADKATARNNLGLKTAATADLTTSATDTTAGRALKVGDGGLLSGDSGTSEDIDAIRTSRFFYQGNSATNKFGDGGNGTVLSAIGLQGEFGWQFGKLNNGPWSGRRINGGVWQDNEDFYTTANVLGTVSQSGGVPTGALFQQISNSEGSARLSADGLCIVHSSVALDVGVSASNVEVDIPVKLFVRDGKVDNTIPGFVSGPYGGSGISSSDLFAASATVRVNSGSTTARFSMRDPDALSGGGEFLFKITLIGYWYA